MTQLQRKNDTAQNFDPSRDAITETVVTTQQTYINEVSICINKGGSACLG